MYRESDVEAGSGVVYNEVVNAIQRRGVTHVAIFGYSQGGGATYVLANALNTNRQAIGIFTIDVTAYIDGVRHTGWNPEDRTPPGTLHHANYWQDHASGVLGLHGASIPGSHPNLNVRTTTWGANLDHFTIDDDQNVRDGVEGEIRDNLAVR